jgi:hypothetical protein
MTEDLKFNTHWMAPDVDAGGRTTPGYWRTAVWCTDGRVVLGSGAAKEDAQRDARKRAEEHHAFIAKPAKERLLEVLSSRPLPDYLLSSEVTVAIHALAELVLAPAADSQKSSMNRRVDLAIGHLRAAHALPKMPPEACAEIEAALRALGFDGG